MKHREKELLYLTFARVNPVFFQRVLREIGKEDGNYRNELAERVEGFAFPTTFLGYSGPRGTSPAQNALAEIYHHREIPHLTDVHHVFPVWNEALNIGLMVPMAISPADDWHISDAFGRFGFQPGARENPFTSLLKIIEQKWDELKDGQILPLRWRQPLALKVLCQVHLEAIGGDSLQVPLIVAVLRSFARQADSAETEGTLPFGNRPVFASGILGADLNRFWNIGHLNEKLAGFIREYGAKLPALLQQKQIEELHPELLDQVEVYPVNSLEELLRLKELSSGLERLTGRVHPTEIDMLLTVMANNRRALRFDDVEGMVSWLLPHLDSPIYRFRLHREAGLVFGHRGKFIDGNRELDSCRALERDHGDLLGVADRCDLTTLAGVIAHDALQPHLATRWLDELEGGLALLSLPKRVAFWGTRCQLYRLEGCYDDAVAAGQEAVRLADLGRASDSGRDRNYLIHALLNRARDCDDANQRGRDLRSAQRLLTESMGEWAPCDDVSARRSHLCFCLHFQAELARLEKVPFTLPDTPPWAGYWNHAWYFALLSCARNEVHQLDTRRHHAAKLVTALQNNRACTHPDSLFFMFLQVYRIYAAALSQKTLIDPVEELKKWCAGLEKKGFSGWKIRLSPCLDDLANSGSSEATLQKAERLCDLIPYH